MYKLHLKNYNNTAYSDKGKIPLTQFLTEYKYKTRQISGVHLRWLTWLLTGHSPLAYFQHRAQNFSSPECAHCPEEQETSQHFLCECVGYMTIRLRSFGKVFLTMEEISIMDISKIIKYISDTKRLEQDDLFG